MQRASVFFFLIGCVISGSLWILVPKVDALSVIKDSTYYTIENDYFIAKIPHTFEGYPAGAGTISQMYIKPETSVNIVSHKSGFSSLVGAEYCQYNGTDGWGYSAWSPTTMHSLDVTKVVETSTYVTIRSQIVWRTESFSSTPNHTLTIYMTFYDQPYYLITLERIQEDDYTQIANSQICFLYDTDDYWDKDEDSWYASNRTGHAVANYSKGAYLNEASIYGKFPWFWVYNASQRTGHGTILIDSNRPVETAIGYLAGGVSGSYSEYQIDIGQAERYNEPLSLSFIGYGRGTTDYSYIDTLATDLYESRKTALTSDDYNYPLMMNYKHSRASYNIFGRMRFKLRPISTAWGFLGWDRRIYGITWQSCYFNVVNSTNTYGMFDWASVSVPMAYQNGSYATVTWNRHYDNRYNWTAKFEVWDDSDTMNLTLTLETTATVNITDAYFRWFSGRYDDATWMSFSGQPDYVKLNVTDTRNYLIPIIKEEAYLVKNLTNTPRTLNNANGYFYWVDNDNDVEYSSGQTWTIALQIQYFKRYVAWHTDYVNYTDFKAPMEHESEMETINYQSWLQLPLFSQQSKMSINTIGSSHSQVAYSSFSKARKLTLLFVGDSGVNVKRQIYCGENGKPTKFIGATSWNYNSATHIVTVYVTHSSGKEVEVEIKFARAHKPRHVGKEI